MMSKVYLFPIAVFIVCQSTFMFTSIAAVLEGHVPFPYISEGGTNPPESCIFSQFINLGCILLGIVIYIRYRQIQQLMHQYNELIGLLEKLNKAALWFGYVACLGFSIVANFQLTNFPTIHYIGGITCFGLGIAYFWLQAYITYNARAYTGSARLAFIRFSLAALCTYFFFVTILTSCSVYGVIFQEQPPKNCNYLKVSVVGEWIVATTFNISMLSFTNEFKYISFEHPKILIEKSDPVTLNESNQMTESIAVSIPIMTHLNGWRYIENYV